MIWRFPPCVFTTSGISNRCSKKESIRHSHWFVDGVIKYHRTVETHVNAFIAGIALGIVQDGVVDVIPFPRLAIPAVRKSLQLPVKFVEAGIQD